MKIGSLFSGIGGLELGLERAGVGHTVWQVEQDGYCRDVLARHWPNAKRYEDVKDVGRHNLAPVDVICGGFPCQDISNAGRKVGLVGERSGLWFEFDRIVRELRPRFVVVENVAALLARGLDVVLGCLAESRYDAEWSCVQAVDVGAPHKRDRLFVVAYAQDGLRRAHGRSMGHCEGKNEGAPCGGIVRQGHRGAGNDGSPAGRPYMADASLLLSDGGEDFPGGGGEGEGAVSESGNGAGHERTGSGWWAVEPDVGRLAYGLPAGVVDDPLSAYGNAVVPQVAEVVGRVLLQIHYELEAAQESLTPASP